MVWTNLSLPNFTNYQDDFVVENPNNNSPPVNKCTLYFTVQIPTCTKPSPSCTYLSYHIISQVQCEPIQLLIILNQGIIILLSLTAEVQIHKLSKTSVTVHIAAGAHTCFLFTGFHMLDCKKHFITELIWAETYSSSVTYTFHYKAHLSRNILIFSQVAHKTNIHTHPQTTNYINIHPRV